MAAYGSAVVLLGLSLGMPQWRILCRHVQRASLWILFSVIVWGLIGVAWITFGAGSGEDAIAYGIVAGLGLGWLMHFQPFNVKAEGSNQ